MNWLVLLILTFLPGVLSAKEPHPAAEQEPSIIWKVANFALLAGGLGYLISKHAGPFFATRSQQILKGISEAQAFRADAESRAAAVDARLNSLDTEIEQLQKTARDEHAMAEARMREETAVELARIRSHTEQEIASAVKTATLELRRHSAALALQAAEQKIRARLTPQIQNVLVQDFLRKLETPASREHSTV